MGTYGKLNLPENDLEVVKLTDFQREMLAKISERAYANGKWDHAVDFRIDFNDIEFGAYYINKSVRPILKPLKGHDELEGIFNAFRRTQFVLNGGSSGRSFLISTAGDLMATADLEQSKDTMYDDVESFLFDADLCFANLESTFSDGEIVPFVISSEEGPKINLDLPQYRTLTDCRGKKYDLLQLANNHIIDCGTEGIARTLAQLREDGILWAGVNADEGSSCRAVITKKDGVRIGWVVFTAFLNNRSLPEGKEWLVNTALFDPFEETDLSKITEQIRSCREEHCDLVIVAMHWGLEMEFYPHPKQREWAQIFTDAGADIVIGQHPHVIQYAEIMHPKDDPAKDVPVVYSQGNLTSVSSGAACCLSTLLRFRAERTASGMKVAGMEVLPVAVVRRVSGEESFVELKKLTTLLAIKPALDEQMRDYIDRMAEYADMVLGTEWRQQNF